MAYASGSSDYIPGGAQASLYVLRNTTSDASEKELFLDGGWDSQRISIPAGSTWTFEALVVGRTRDSGEFSTALSVGFRIRR